MEAEEEVMATDLQKDLAEAIVKNMKKPRHKRKNKTELLESIGYAPTTAAKEQKTIIESKGVREALAEWGLTEELITTALVDDINNKPTRRVKELGLGAEILGMKKREEGGNKTLILVVSGESAQRFNVKPDTDTK